MTERQAAFRKRHLAAREGGRERERESERVGESRGESERGGEGAGEGGRVLDVAAPEGKDVGSKRRGNRPNCILLH